MAHQSTGQTIDQPKGRFDRIIETIAEGLGGGIGWLVDHWVLFGLFAFLWLVFGVAIVASPASLDQAWQTIGAWPLPVQLVAWLLFLPVMAGLWAWETDWPLVARLVIVVGLAAWNLLVFRPSRAKIAGGSRT